MAVVGPRTRGGEANVPQLPPLVANHFCATLLLQHHYPAELVVAMKHNAPHK